MNNKIITTFIANDQVSPTVGKISANVSSAGVAISKIASAILSLGSTASSAATNATPLRNILENIEKSSAGTEKGVHRATKEISAISGASDKAARSLQKISDEGVKLKRGLLDNATIATTALRNTARVLQVAARALSAPLAAFGQFENVATRLAPKLAGGLGEARELARALRLEAAHGTESFEKLASVAAKLTSVFSSTEDVKKWTNVFHNLAAGTGSDVSELVNNFVRSRARDKVDSSILDAFAQKGINLYDEITRKTGLAESAIRKMAQQGRLSFAEIEAAILAVSTGTGQFAGAAEEASNTFAGNLEKMKASWEALLADIAEPVAQTLTPFFRAASSALNDLAPHAQTIGQVVLAIAKLALPITAIAAAAKAFTALSAAITFSQTKMQAFAAATSAGFARATTGALAFAAAVKMAGDIYISHLEEQADKARLLSDAVKKLADAQSAMDTAKTAEQFNRAKKSAEGLIRYLEANGDRLAKEAGTTFGLRLDTTKEVMAAVEERKRKEFAVAAAIKERLGYTEEELKKMREHSAALRAEITKQRIEAARAGAETISSKINLELSLVNSDTVDALDRELSALENAVALTDEQKQRAEQLLSAREKIAALERESSAARSALREKIALMQAELAGNEKLIALKEKLYKADLRSQFLKAGVGLDKLDEHVERYLALEKQLEEKRRKDKASDALAADEEEMKILRAKADGDAERVAQLERERAEREHIAKLEAQGVATEEAKRRARERTLATLAAENRAQAAQQAASRRTEAFEVLTARGRTRRDVSVALAPATATAPVRATPVSSLGSAATETLLSATIAIRDNTRGILDAIVRGANPQKVLVNPVLG